MTADKDRPGEFDVIKNIFSPLSRSAPGAFNLTDDAAVFSVTTGSELVVTKDAMVAGVHFLPHDKPQNIARKLLRTNLSDIAAMGAKPTGYLLAAAWTDACDEAWLECFAEGLAQDQETFGITLLGGDTVRTPGPLTLSLTLFGEIPKGQCLRRNGAKAGDLICVSGTIGDGALGLRAALDTLEGLDESNSDALQQRYFIPEPRVYLGPALVGLATACLDISDGLLADVGHICQQSKLGAVLHQHKIPLSRAANMAVSSDLTLWDCILGGGDDYELAFTLPADKFPEIVKKAENLTVNVTVIGEMTLEPDLKLLGAAGENLKINAVGWTHF